MHYKAITALLVASLASSTALADTQADEWQFSITPYLWLPTIGGDMNYSLPPGTGGGGDDAGAGISVGPTDWLELLNAALLVSASASRGDYSLYTDLVYLRLKKDGGSRVRSVDTSITGPGGGVTIPVSASLELDTTTEFDGYLFTLAAGYAYHSTEESTHSVMLGARRLDLDAFTDWSLTAAVTTPGNEVVLPAEGRLEANTAEWDGIIGLRGRFALGDGKWSLPYSVDVGKGGSDLTWMGQVSIVREYGWGDLFLGYRHLYYDQGSDGLLKSFTFSGPGFGASFSF